MKQLLYIFTLMLFGSSLAFTQVRKKAEVEKILSLPFNADIVGVNVVKNKFFVVKTAANYLKKSKNNVLHYYSADLSKSWSLPIQTKSNQSIVIASEFTPYIYHIEKSWDISLNNVFMRVDANGKATQLKLKSSFTFPRSERKIAYFSTSNRLCMLSVSDNESTRQSTVTINKKKTKITLAKSYLVLHTLNHSDKKLIAKKIKTPFESRISDAPVHFELLAQEDSIFYVLKKERGKSYGAMDLSVYVLNDLGDIKDTWSWTVDAVNDLVPVFNVREANGAFVNNMDYHKDVSTSYGTMGASTNQVNTTTTTTTTTISAGSMGSNYVDLVNNEIYVVSFTNDIQSPVSKGNNFSPSTLKQSCKQMRIQKYEFSTGEFVGEKAIKIPDEITKDKSWATTKIMGVHLSDMGNMHLKISLLGLHKVYVLFYNTQTKALSYMAKEIPLARGFKSLNSNYNHRIFQSNLLLHKDFSSVAYTRYLQGFSDWRSNEYSINGLDLGKNMIVIKNGAYASRNANISFKVFAK